MNITAKDPDYPQFLTLTFTSNEASQLAEDIAMCFCYDNPVENRVAQTLSFIRSNIKPGKPFECSIGPEALNDLAQVLSTKPNPSTLSTLIISLARHHDTQVKRHHRINKQNPR